MPSVGQALQMARLRHGLTIEAVSARTKISARMLRAIESDSPYEISGFFYRSFVRQLAALFDVPYAELSADVELNIAAVETAAPRTENRPYTPRIRPIGPGRDGDRGWAVQVLSFCAVLVTCWALYAAVDKGAVDVSTLAKFDIRNGSPLVASLPSIGSLFGSEGSANVIVPTRPETPRRAPVSVRISAIERTWLSADADGRHVYSGLLRPDDTKELTGRDSAKLETGNAGGIEVVFNGRRLGTLGNRGQVQTVLFTRDQYEILRPALSSRLRLLPFATLAAWRN